jgi:polar amino acid transport system substrate-binding protein
MGYPPIKISVNISAKHFLQNDLVDKVNEILAETGLAPQWLELEITESVAVSDLNFTKKILGMFREKGIGVSLDDFGTGYSSLNYLKQLPIDTLKVDRAFIKDLKKNTTEEEIVKTLILLAHSMKLSVIAEGVETFEQLDILIHHDCDNVQGYFFSKPRSLEEIDEPISLGFITNKV